MQNELQERVLEPMPILEETKLKTDEEGAKKATLFKNIANGVLLVLIIAIAAFLIKAYAEGNFKNITEAKEYVQSFGVFGPLIVTIFQMMQVLIPFFPCQFGYAAGGMLFGTWGGFLCNYIGISIGSLLSFWFAKTYGVAFVKKIISPEKYDKYANWVNTKPNYLRLLTICFLLPMAPDDFLCFFSGLCKVDFKKFLIITVLAKPWCLLLYSYLFDHFGEYAFEMLKLA